MKAIVCEYDAVSCFRLYRLRYDRLNVAPLGTSLADSRQSV